MNSSKIQLPDIFQEAFNPYRYKIYYGGRGSGKSWTIARILLIKAIQGKIRILCTREIQKSIKDSVHRLLTDQIDLMGFNQYFTYTNDMIVSSTGSEFLFTGLYRNISRVKSIEGIDICWIEEAHSVSSESWDLLIPTIRKPNSEIWITFNRERPDDPVYTKLMNPAREGALIQRVNYYDNPMFPDVLKQEMEYDKRVDYDKYLHIWEGEPLAHSQAQIFKGKWKVDRFDTDQNEVFYHGVDWGFAVDPTVMIRCFIKDNTLYIDREVYGIGIDIDKLPAMFSKIDTSKSWKSIADNARPETISYMRNAGYNMYGTEKGKGSVEDGIEFIKSFEQIIIHEDCQHTIDEFKMYSYKQDKLTGEILPVVEDKHNHVIDAIRYALNDIIKSRMLRSSGITAFQLGL